MNWEYLFLLACPLMMVFCMLGLFSGKKDKAPTHNAVSQANQGVQQSEILELQTKLTEIMQQNQVLLKEIKEIKEEKEEKIKNEEVISHQHKKGNNLNVVEENKASVSS